MLLLGLTLLSALLSGDPGRGFRQFLGAWTVCGLYLAVCYTGDEAYLRRLLRLLFVPAAVIAAYAVFQHFTGMDVIRPAKPLESLAFGESLVYFPRGAFSHYQTFSNVFYLLFCLSLSMALHNPSQSERRIWRLFSLPIGTALVLSSTRGVWLATFCAVIFISLFLGKKAFRPMAAAGAVAALVVLLSSPGILSRARTMVDVRGNVERFLLWETTWNMIRDYPLLGVGVGSYQRVQSGYIREDVDIPMTRTHSHNNLLQVTVERGVFALFLFIWLWYCILLEGFRRLWKWRRDRDFSFALVLGCLTGALGFFLDGMFQNNFGDTEVIIIFWFMTGMMLRERAGTRASLREVRGW
jgi:O-antigen ligase